MLVAAAGAFPVAQAVDNTFGVPAASVGDRGIYAVHSEYEDSDGVDSSDHRETFEWTAARPFLHGSGSWHWVHQFRTDYVWADEDANESFDPNGTLRPGVRAHHFDASTMDPIAVSGVTRGSGHGSAYSSGLFSGSASQSWSMLSTIFSGSLSFCGFRSDFQGSTVDLNDPVGVQGLCTASGGALFNVTAVTGAAPDRLVGVETVDEYGVRFSLVFSESVAYPVERRVEGEFVYDNQTIRFDIGWVLEHWEQGSGPFGPAGGLPADLVWPAVEFEPRGPTGPDAGGFDHPFPVEDADRAARAHDEDLAAFLDAHPDAYLAEAQYRLTRSQGDSSEYAWELWYSNGTVAYMEWVTLYRERPHEKVFSALGAPNVLALDRIGVFGFEWEITFHPAESEAPQMLPTIASLVPRWEAFAPQAQVEAGPDSWSFAARCTDWSCLSAHATTGVGFFSVEVPEEPLLAGYVDGRVEASAVLTQVRVNHTGNISAFDQIFYHEEEEWQSVLPPPPDPGAVIDPLLGPWWLRQDCRLPGPIGAPQAACTPKG